MEMSGILADLSSDLSWRSVVLMTSVCASASLLVIYILRRGQAATGGARTCWILAGGAVLGCGIWAVYFMGTLLHEASGAAPNATPTTLSLAIVGILAGVGLWQAIDAPAHWRAFIAGGFIGAAITAASQITMIAGPMSPNMTWSSGLIFASSALGMSLAAAALVIAGDENTVRRNIAAALVLALAILSHQLAAVGMAAINSETLDAELLNSATVVTVALAAMALVTIALLGARANAQMRERDRRLNLAINAMSRGFLLFDGNERIISCNDRYLQIYGLDKGVIKPGMSLDSLIRHRLEKGTRLKDRERYKSDFHAIRSLRETSTTQIELEDGRTISMTNTPLPDGGWLGIHEDITERLHFEASLEAARVEREKAHRRLMEAFEAVPVGLSMLDADNRYVLWNSRFSDIYSDVADLLAPGQRFEDVVRASISRGQHPGFRGSEEQCLIEQLARLSEPNNSHEQHLSGDRWIRVEDRRMSDGGTISVRVDISDIRRREESFRLLFEENPTPMIVYDRETLRLLAVNDAALAQYGYDRDVFLSMTVLDIRPPEDREEIRRIISAPEFKPVQGRIRRHLKADGSLIEVAIYSRALDYQGRPSCIATAIDLTELRRIESDARKTRDFLNAIIEHVPSIIIVKDAQDLSYVLVNRSAEQYFGLSRDNIIGKTSNNVFSKAAADLINVQDQQLLKTRSPQVTGDYPIQMPNGETRIVSSTRLLILGEDGEPKYLVTVIQDRTEAKDAEARISHMAHLAHHDPLTDLPNRALFNKHFASTIESASLTGSRFALMCIDLDRFKDVNDLFGHGVGDALLREVSRRLRTAAADSFVARLGGDEFVAITAADAAETIAQRMLAAVTAEDLEIDGQRLAVGLSIGIATFPDQGADASVLLANADAALYQAKAAGRGTACFFGTDSQISRLRTLQHEMASVDLSSVDGCKTFRGPVLCAGDLIQRP